jgi:hypothetical protein
MVRPKTEEVFGRGRKLYNEVLRNFHYFDHNKAGNMGR